MSYMHIENLYKSQEIFLFKECYAMEKIHGTSAHISFKNGKVEYSSGGSSPTEFVKNFNTEDLTNKLTSIVSEKALDVDIIIYGEAYGGKLQGMRETYGDKLRFVVFEVKIGDKFLNVKKAHDFACNLGLDFVHYNRIPTTMEAINFVRDSFSVQAIKNGMGAGHLREGIVLRPIEEVTLNNGERVISKYKRDEFKETSTAHEVSSEKMKVLEDAKAIAEEWVTVERIRHVTDGMEIKIENIGKIIPLVQEDVIREARDEIVDNMDVRREIGRATAILIKKIS